MSEANSTTGQIKIQTATFIELLFFIIFNSQPVLTKISTAMILPYCVYVLISKKDGLFYIGYTTNIYNRIKNHNEGKTISTAKRRPLELIFCEFYQSKQDAMRREKYFKTTAGKKCLKLMLKETIQIYPDD
jgi:putative endonuclease